MKRKHSNKDLHRNIIIQAPKHKKKKIEEEYNEKLCDKLPKLPFFTALVGPRNTGKSNLARNILSKESGMYGAVFKDENKILYKPTIDFDHTLDELKLEQQFGSDTDLRLIISELYNQLLELEKDDNVLPVLLILDDMTLDLACWNILIPLAVEGRHKKAQVLFICHKMSSIPRMARTQIQQFILFRPHEQSEWIWVLDTFATKGTRSIWLAAISRAWETKFNFVYIDFERDWNDQYHSGFNDPLFTPQEDAEMKQIMAGLIPARRMASADNEAENKILNDETLVPDIEQEEPKRKKRKTKS